MYSGKEGKESKRTQRSIVWFGDPFDPRGFRASSASQGLQTQPRGTFAGWRFLLQQNQEATSLQGFNEEPGSYRWEAESIGTEAESIGTKSGEELQK